MKVSARLGNGLGTYLKAAREERGLPLDRISADTKINRALLADAG